jgi:TrkA domain protein
MSPDVHVRESDLPGIGRRYEIDGIDCAASVVLHHSGRRDLYVQPTRRGDPPAVVSLTDRQARQLGAILGGAYFTPAVVEEMEAVIGELLIDWVTLTKGGSTIAELEVRRRTGMTIAAISRSGGHDTIIAPDPDTLLQPGDRLVVVGRRQDLSGFMALVT